MNPVRAFLAWLCRVIAGLFAGLGWYLGSDPA